MIRRGLHGQREGRCVSQVSAGNTFSDVRLMPIAPAGLLPPVHSPGLAYHHLHQRHHRRHRVVVIVPGLVALQRPPFSWRPSGSGFPGRPITRRAPAHIIRQAGGSLLVRLLMRRCSRRSSFRRCGCSWPCRAWEPTSAPCRPCRPTWQHRRRPHPASSLRCPLPLRFPSLILDRPPHPV